MTASTLVTNDTAASAASTGHQQAVVVGAGLAGLAAAYRLQKLGWQVRVIETRNYPGGRAASLQQQGYLIDTGATGIGDCYTDYLALVDELGLNHTLVEASTITGTLRDGVIHEVDGARPFRTGLFSRLFSWRSKLILPRLFRDLKAIGNKLVFQDVSRAYEWDDESAERYALRRLNKEIFDYFVDPVLRALVVVRGNFVSKLELMNAINGLFGTRILANIGGVGLLPHALAEKLDITYCTRVTQVTEKGDGVSVQYIDAAGQQHTETTDICVMATLLSEAVELFPACEPWVKLLSDDLHYVPGICVHLGYKQRTQSQALMVLLSTREEPEISLIWLDHNKAPDRAPIGHSLFYFYYDDAVADVVGQRSNEALIAQCCQLIETHFPELLGQHDMSLVSRWQAAVPAPVTGYYRRMHEVKKNLDQQQRRVTLAGDYLSCVGQNTAIYYGNQAADKLHHCWSSQISNSSKC